MSPQLWVSILTLAGTIVGYAFKQWLAKADERLRLEAIVKQESTGISVAIEHQADQAAGVNASIQKQNQALDNWMSNKT